METMRTHILIPKDLIEAIDKIVGSRGRSAFFAEAARHELERRRLIEAAARAAGSLADTDAPGWETPEQVSEWVRALRQEDDERLERMGGS